MNTIENSPIAIDKRLKALSYSSSLLLHSCPRKYQLYKLGAVSEEDTGSVTFAFGHAVGEGIQSIVKGLSWNDTVWNMFLAWDYDLLAEETKDKKSFWYAVHAMGKFQSVCEGLLIEYEIAYVVDPNLGELIPATELSFKISLPNEYTYVGYVDLVLRQKLTNQLLVLEVKTTKYTVVNAATYKNSAQAIGYSVVLDSIASEHTTSDYRVLYLVYKSSAMEFEPLIFPKSFTQRATWIQQMMLDIDLIEHYSNEDFFPMYGESCFDYFRECVYLTTCTISTSLVTTSYENHLKRMEYELATGKSKPKTYTINVSLADLINAQLAKQLIGES